MYLRTNLIKKSSDLCFVLILLTFGFVNHLKIKVKNSNKSIINNLNNWVFLKAMEKE